MGRRLRSVKLTDDVIGDALAKAIATPAKVEVDGRIVTARPAGELTELINYATAPTARAENLLSISRFSPGGSPLE